MPRAELHVLLVDDDEALREITTYQLRGAGFRVTACEGGAEAIATFLPRAFDVVVTDLKMPRVDGMQVLAALRKQDPSTPVLVITAFGSIDVAVEAMRAGAHDFITKPFAREAFLLKVRRAAEHGSVLRENRSLRSQVEASATRPMLVVSGAMRDLMRRVERIADSDLPVLLEGDSGTGKELVARELHRRSTRAARPFVAINCGAVPADLLEAELFGHVRGAFTGAAKEREGRFRRAHGGTLLLDEIGDLPLSLQPKLLRVLQEHAVVPVGGDRPIPVDVRLVAATHRDLPARIRDGTFREDLYYRIAVVPLRIPPLRERAEAVVPLFELFLRAQARRAGRTLTVSVEAARELERRPWPGNVRQLENLARRVALLAPGPTIGVQDLEDLHGALAPVQGAGSPRSLRVDTSPDPWDVTLPEESLPLPELEARLVIEAIRKFGGNKSAAARYLGIPRHVLLYRLEKYGIASDAV